MDIRLREIAGKAAGTYFIVTDNSQVPEIIQTSNLRLFFINEPKGPVNTVVVFTQGDTTSLQSVFGKTTRKKEKQGNFGMRACVEAISTSNIAVMNLRSFDDLLDIAQVMGMSLNKELQEVDSMPYRQLFNTNSLWTIKPKNIIDGLDEVNLLNFANVGTSNVSFFVTLSNTSSVDLLTSEGDATLESTSLEVEDYPALAANPKMKIRESFVTVWVFNNTFDALTVSTNKYYGQLFNASGLITEENLQLLTLIPESGFNRKITGSVIPNLVSENAEEISIDAKMNLLFAETNLICNINDEVLELEDISGFPVIINDILNYYDLVDGTLDTTGIYLSHRLLPFTKVTWASGTLQDLLDLQTVSPNQVYTDVNLGFTTSNLLVTDETQNKIVDLTNVGLIKLTVADNFWLDVDNKNKAKLPYDFGYKIGQEVKFGTEILTVLSIDLGSPITITNGPDSVTYQNSTYTFNAIIPDVDTAYIVKSIDKISVNKFNNLQSYVMRDAQFINGTASRQNDILDIILSPGIVKGLKNFTGLRYLIDTFKSFVEPSYKSQFGQLCKNLDNSNKFVRAIINEPFIEDLENSTNPLFKQTPSGTFDFSYLPTGGNANYSTVFLSKFTVGGEMCFAYGSKLDTDGKTEVISAPSISNLFVSKTFAWDVLANATGYVDFAGIAFDPDENERLALEQFKWNPIIKTRKGITIYGNYTCQKAKTSLSQIHNSELLAYIKESLLNMSIDEAFKKGTYGEYLSTEVSIQSFMNDLALREAIQPNPIVICNASNNTTEIQQQRIKLIRVEYFNINSLDKVVFELNVN